MSAGSGGSSDMEFDFWAAQRTQLCGNCSDSMEFGMDAAEGFYAFSPPLWKTKETGRAKKEFCPLLSHQKGPRTSRRQAIAEGRRELMELVKMMPESSYELSLRDIVEEELVLKEAQEETSSGMDAPPKTPKLRRKKKKSSSKVEVVCRTGSMGSHTFMIKLFFPGFVWKKKKTRPGNHAKVSPSPRPSFEESLDHLREDGWMKKIFDIGDHQSNTTTKGHASGSFTTGCWSFGSKKSRTRSHRGCLF